MTKTTIEELETLIAAARETRELEFKSARENYDIESTMQYCVALANEGGGKLVLGVTNAHPRRVVATRAFENPNKIEEKILDKLGFRVTVEEIFHPDGRVLVFHIPSRPQGVPREIDGKFLMRSGERLVAMSTDQITAIIREGHGEWLLESVMSDLTADQVVQLLDTQYVFELLKMPYPADRDGVMDRLRREKLVRQTISGFAITNLGALLFAKRLDDFGSLSRKAARVIVYRGVSKVETSREQTGGKGYAVAFQALVEYVDSQTPANEVIGSALRTSVRMYPPIMLRETIANALVHQDLELTGTSVMIEIYSDRIEISNPGAPCVEVDRFIDECRSRNELLAATMRRYGICEEKGSGIDKVIHAAELYQLPAPDFRVDSVRTTCVLYGQRPFAEMSREDRIRACYQHCVLNYVTHKPTTNQSLRARFGLADDKAETASRVLGEAVDAGLIKRRDPESGSKKYTSYVPIWG
jgi:ATP-dependent DNA helicase RecG